MASMRVSSRVLTESQLFALLPSRRKEGGKKLGGIFGVCLWEPHRLSLGPVFAPVKLSNL